jgi:hypothetical protein
MYNRFLQARAAPEEGGAPFSPPPKPAGLLSGLPGRLETGDLILFLILLLVWLEKEDEEILILLSALIVMSL